MRAMSLPCQPGILRAAPAHGRFLTFELRHGVPGHDVLRRLAAMRHDRRAIIGIGQPLLTGGGHGVQGLRPFPSDLGLFPAAQGALWVFLTHADPGASFDAGTARIEVDFLDSNGTSLRSTPRVQSC